MARLHFLGRSAMPAPVLLLLLSFLVGCAYGKYCTNTGLQSHTLRSQFVHAPEASSSFQQQLQQLVPQAQRSTHPARTMIEKNHDSEFLQPPSLHEVRLAANSTQGIAQQTNLDYLLLLDVDRLVHSFRVTAGLNSVASPYGGWEAQSSELRGHFVGHYLSASALMWASTHNESLRVKMEALVDALAECQDSMKTGYLSAFPSSFFDRFEALKTVWAPYYTIHKIMAGLLSQYTLAHNEKALGMALKMADYFFDRVQAVIQNHTVERHWQSLNEETGGMNDVLYQIYGITGMERYLELAHLFDKPCFLGLLAVEADSLSGFHANTHIPIVVGAQMRFEIVGDHLYKDIAKYFMDIVNSSHVYATGGTSSGEFWQDPKRLATTLETENAESCTTYNMLKIARNLFRWTKNMIYADYYERALLNAVLSIQRTEEPGVMLYMTPMAPGCSKAKSYHGWGTKYDSFWCCYGTGIESFSKLGDSIYFEETSPIPGLYIVQYVSSTLFWKSTGLTLEQIVEPLNSYDATLRVSISFSKAVSEANSTMASLFVRIPYWSGTGKATLNGAPILLPEPGSFLVIEYDWSQGDRLSLELQAKLRIEPISDDRIEYESLIAIFYGPYLLAGLTQGDWDLGPVNKSSLTDWLVPVHPSSASRLFSFHQRRRRVSALEADDEDEEEQVLSYQDGQVSMLPMPSRGTSRAVDATFRVASPMVNTGSTFLASASDLTYKVISLELMSRPGTYLSHNGVNERVVLLNHRRHQGSLRSVFQVLPALSGEKDSVSFEAAGLPGCFLQSSRRTTKPAAEIVLKCSYNDDLDKVLSSFMVNHGLSSYHPMSFVAHGSKTSYLLFPFTDYRDEQYTVYFNTSR